MGYDHLVPNKGVYVIIYITLCFLFVQNIFPLVSVQYTVILYSYLKKWRKNQHCSFSCCLALFLPLNDLEGEIQDLVGTDVVSSQLQTGQTDAPTVIEAVKDSGAIDVNLEEGRQEEEFTTMLQEENCRGAEFIRKKCHKQNQTELFKLPLIVEETHL